MVRFGPEPFGSRQTFLRTDIIYFNLNYFIFKFVATILVDQKAAGKKTLDVTAEDQILLCGK